MKTKYELKEIGETLYVRAMRAQELCDHERAKTLGLTCLDIYKRIGAETLEDVSPLVVGREGYMLPNYLHARIVAERLGLEEELKKE